MFLYVMPITPPGTNVWFANEWIAPTSTMSTLPTLFRTQLEGETPQVPIPYTTQRWEALWRQAYALATSLGMLPSSIGIYAPVCTTLPTRDLLPINVKIAFTWTANIGSQNHRFLASEVELNYLGPPDAQS